METSNLQKLQASQCQNHQQQIMFVCACNEWHFHPLCTKCVVDHSKIHNNPNGPKSKNALAMNLVDLDSILSKASSMGSAFFREYCIRKSTIQTAIQDQFRTIKQFIVKEKQTAHSAIEKFYNSVESEIISAVSAKALKVSAQLEKALSMLESLATRIKDPNALDDVKLVYFKTSTDLYFEEVDETLEEYRNITDPRVYVSSMDQQKLKAELTKLIVISKLPEDSEKMQKSEECSNKNNVKAVQDNQPQPSNTGAKNPQTKKTQSTLKSKIVSQPKICKECGSELEYLTALKKHLVCKGCGNQQRNYHKKQM